MKQRYFDNAATSWPKPALVYRAMDRFARKGGGNPGRSGHARAIEAGRIVLRSRELLAGLFNVTDPARIVFTKNATEALNLALFGSLSRGNHVITGSMEHNSVLRPLTDLGGRGIEVTVVSADSTGRVDPDSLLERVQENTRLICITHASNVTGTINDVAAIGGRCREKGIRFLVDAAQTAGTVPIDVKRMNIDFLAFSGHKGLLGPQGTGGLYLAAELDPLLHGGTGSLSDREIQPDFLPDRYESGTLNVFGLSGLSAGVAYLLQEGVQSVTDHYRRLLNIFLQELHSCPGVTLYGGTDPDLRTGVLSLNIEGWSPSEAGEALEQRFGILTRIGLHCAPRAHRTIGTFPEGTVRFSWGLFTRECDILAAIRAVKSLEQKEG
jgi:cysteine desulfurase family protein